MVYLGAKGARVRVLAVASIGGHWEQLMMLRDLFDRHDTAFATTDAGLFSAYSVAEGHIIQDCNRNTPLKMLMAVFNTYVIVRSVKPQIIVSTGALPGLLCILMGRFIGAKSVWIDSVANAERLSLCGKLSRYLADACITQWEHLANDPRTKYFGSVL